MKIPLSKRVFRDGMRRTRRLRWLYYALALIGCIIVWRENSTSLYGYEEGIVYYESYPILGVELLCSYIGLVFYVVMVLLEERKLHGYHYSRRIADTMNPLPATEAERYWTNSLVSIVNALIFGFCHIIPVALGCVMANIAESRYSNVELDCSEYFYFFIIILMGGLLLVTLAGMCREMSHSRVLFTVWLIVSTGVLVILQPLIRMYVNLKSNWVADPGDSLNFLTKFSYLTCFATLDVDFLTICALILLMIAFLAFGSFFNKRYSVDYLENEKDNHNMFRLLLIVLDAVAIAMVWVMVYIVQVESLWTVVCSIVFVPLIHWFLCLLYQERHILKTLKYFGVGFAFAVVFWGVCYVSYVEYMRVPKPEDTYYVEINWFDGGMGDSFFFARLFGEGASRYTTGDAELKQMVYDRIQDSIKGRKVEWDIWEEYSPVEYIVTVYTHKKTRSYKVALKNSECMAILDDSVHYEYVTSGEGKKVFQSDVLSEEEIEQYHEILKEEKCDVYQYVTNGFLGGRVAAKGEYISTGVSGLGFKGREKRVVEIPKIGSKMVLGYFTDYYLSEEQSKTASYIYGLLETKYGQKVKEALRDFENRKYRDSSIYFYFADSSVNFETSSYEIGWYKGELILGTQIYDDETGRTIRQKVLSEERTGELIQAFNQYCDGDGRIEGNYVVKLTLHIGLDMDEYWSYYDEKTYQKECTLYMTIPCEVMESFLNEEMEEAE